MSLKNAPVARLLTNCHTPSPSNPSLFSYPPPLWSTRPPLYSRIHCFWTSSVISYVRMRRSREKHFVQEQNRKSRRIRKLATSVSAPRRTFPPPSPLVTLNLLQCPLLYIATDSIETVRDYYSETITIECSQLGVSVMGM